MINLQVEQSRKFELVLQVRDKDGLPTGKTTNVSTDNADEVSGFYEKYRFKKKFKRSKDKAHRDGKFLPKGKEADVIVKDMATYAKTVRTKKRDAEHQEE